MLLENQRKSPTFMHTLRQSPFRASFGPSKSFGGVVAGARGKKNNKKKSK